jgi:hypothetical protein
MHNIWNRRKLIRGKSGYWENTFTAVEGLDAALGCVYGAFTIDRAPVVAGGDKKVVDQVISIHAHITNLASDLYRRGGKPPPQQAASSDTMEGAQSSDVHNEQFKTSVLLGLEYVRRELGQERQLATGQETEPHLRKQSESARELWRALEQMQPESNVNGFSILTNMLVLMADSFCRQGLPLDEKFLREPQSVDDLLSGKYLQLDEESVKKKVDTLEAELDKSIREAAVNAVQDLE